MISIIVALMVVGAALLGARIGYEEGRAEGYLEAMNERREYERIE